MLDLDHPQTQYIFEASAIEDALMRRALQMSVLPSARRFTLLEQCQVGLDELRRLNRAHFENSAFVAQTLNEAEIALNDLARAGNGNITEDSSHGAGNGAVCGTLIVRHEASRYSSKVVYCRHCVEPFMRAKGKLESPEGFGTCFI